MMSADQAGEGHAKEGLYAASGPNSPRLASPALSCDRVQSMHSSHSSKCCVTDASSYPEVRPKP